LACGTETENRLAERAPRRSSGDLEEHRGLQADGRREATGCG
jgi:hypothetical protein